MDVLSQILKSVELRGILYYPTEFRAPFGLAVPANTNVCRFHVAVEGGCYLSTGGERTWLSRGDLALVPHGEQHLLQDLPETPVVDLDEAQEASNYQGRGAFKWGEDGDCCRLVCGHFEFDKEAAHPLLHALPALIHVKATPTYNFRWIDQIMRFIGEETHSERPGSELIAHRLSEILFVQVLRHYAESESAAVPVLAGITDPRQSRALHAMHTRLDHPWTVEELANEAAMSRTAFATEFAALIGMTPMKYLTAQRMGEASRLLRAGESVATIAQRVGYRSEAAFARKFKDHYGVGPGAYRRSRIG